MEHNNVPCVKLSNPVVVVQDVYYAFPHNAELVREDSSQNCKVLGRADQICSDLFLFSEQFVELRVGSYSHQKAHQPSL